MPHSAGPIRPLSRLPPTPPHCPLRPAAIAAHGVVLKVWLLFVLDMVEDPERPSLARLVWKHFSFPIQGVVFLQIHVCLLVSQCRLDVLQVQGILRRG